MSDEDDHRCDAAWLNPTAAMRARYVRGMKNFDHMLLRSNMISTGNWVEQKFFKSHSPAFQSAYYESKSNSYIWFGEQSAANDNVQATDKP